MSKNEKNQKSLNTPINKANFKSSYKSNYKSNYDPNYNRPSIDELINIFDSKSGNKPVNTTSGNKPVNPSAIKFMNKPVTPYVIKPSVAVGGKFGNKSPKATAKPVAFPTPFSSRFKNMNWNNTNRWRNNNTWGNKRGGKYDRYGWLKHKRFPGLISVIEREKETKRLFKKIKRLSKRRVSKKGSVAALWSNVRVQRTNRVLPYVVQWMTTFPFLYKKKWRRVRPSLFFYKAYKIYQLILFIKSRNITLKVLEEGLKKNKKASLFVSALSNSFGFGNISLFLNSIYDSTPSQNLTSERVVNVVSRNKAFNYFTKWSRGEHYRLNMFIQRILNFFIRGKRKLRSLRSKKFNLLGTTAFKKGVLKKVVYKKGTAQKLLRSNRKYNRLLLAIGSQLVQFRQLVDKTSYSFGLHSRLARKRDDRYW